MQFTDLSASQKMKVRVRLAKVVLRGVNFSCSLIVLALVATSFSIFNATRHLAPRNNVPAWANNTATWPQILVLTVACISLALCLLVFWSYWRGGHKRAEKVAVYYTLFAVGFFIFSIIMWGIAAGILQGSRNNSNNKDIWGWSCVDNKRRELFSQDVDYALVCRMQVSIKSTTSCTVPKSILTSIVLVTHLLSHRGHHRMHHGDLVRCCILQILLETTASEVHGCS